MNEANDPVERWRSMVRDAEAARARFRAPAADRWQGRASQFDRDVQARAAEDKSFAALAPLLSRDDVVIDIGAGTGRHTWLLAQSCRRVIAIEPSASMRERLVSKIAERALENVDVVPSRWPTDPLPAADVAFGSHVLYGVEDLAPFVIAMTAAARRRCILIVAERAPSDTYASLRGTAFGFVSPPRPAAREAEAVLRHLGYSPRMAAIPDSTQQVTCGMDDSDLRELCERLDVDPTAENFTRLRDALAHMPRTDDAQRAVIGVRGPEMLLSWDGRSTREP